jgi:hypothetical protein
MISSHPCSPEAGLLSAIAEVSCAADTLDKDAIDGPRIREGNLK